MADEDGDGEDENEALLRKIADINRNDGMKAFNAATVESFEDGIENEELDGDVAEGDEEADVDEGVDVLDDI
jgi:hypothetical protein